MSALAITSEPLPHQEDAVAKLLPSRVGAMFMDMGTGKSLALLMLAAARGGRWDRLFWITPCALRENVRREIAKHTDISPERIALWDSRTLGAVPDDALIHIIGVETLSASDRAVLAFARLVTPESFVAVDESITIKHSRSKRSRRITSIASICRYRVVMTGTPITQGIIDLWGQCLFLSPRVLGYRSWWMFSRTHIHFEERHDPATGRMRRTGRVLGTSGEQVLAERLAPYAYQVTKDECLALPDKGYQWRWTTLTAEQREAYEGAKAEILELDYDDWSPIAIFRLFTALQTITCGWWPTIHGQVVELEETRTDLTCRVAAEASGHVVIWGKYRRCVETIAARLNREHGDGAAHMYYGDQSSAERERALAAWRQDGGYLVATQAIGGHGLTLAESSTAIFHADGYKYSERLQAEDRMHRIGQTRSPLYISIGCSGSIDERIGAALCRKANGLDEFRGRMASCRRRRLKDRARALVRAL